MSENPIQDQFLKCSNFPLPSGVSEPLWKYHHKYPSQGSSDQPWLKIDHRKHPRDFSKTILDYILRGNVNADDKFYVSEEWKHAPWLHCGLKGREPLSGLRFGGAVEPRYISESQNRWIQCWLNSYFNDHAASTLHKIWGDGSEEPTLNAEVVKFPPGSVIFETVFCDASDKEIYSLKGAPTIQACIIDRPSKPDEEPNPEKRARKPEDMKISTLNLIQTDFAARVHDAPNEIGWVFGTFIHDGTAAQSHGPGKWDNLIPVGIEWGNDPTLTQESYDNGKLSKECWINTRALDIVSSFKGSRPWLGWHGRLNGPIDDFTSTCTSCHATAQIDTRKREDRKRIPWTQGDEVEKVPKDGLQGIYVDKNPKEVTKWFKDLKAGEPWDTNYVSADYNRHIQFSYENFRDWNETGRCSTC